MGVRCESQRIAGTPDRYSLPCSCSAEAAAGEYSVEIAPRSVLAGRNEEAVPYNIPPVEALLAVEGGDTMAVQSAPSEGRTQ